MTCISHIDVEEDLRDAADFYERQQKGLGNAFLDTYEEKLREIAASPKRFPIADPRRSIRRARMPPFSYAVEYRSEPTRVFIVVVKHTARDPSFGRGRK